MLPDTVPQLIETLLRLRHLDAADLSELIQQLPDPQAYAREMVRRGWITESQFSALFPAPQRRATARETILEGFADDDADGDHWDLPLSDEEENADCSPEVE